MKTTKLLAAAVVSVGLAFSVAAQATEERELVEMSKLPAAVQKTIKEKAAGGEILRIEKEENENGKWIYEVVVKTKGKEWDFEVDTNGKYIGKHDENTEHKEKGEKY